MFAVAAFGFIDATYLTVEHYLNKIPPCSLVHGCEKVTTSIYSTFYGIPTSLLGSVYYLIIIVALLAYFDAHRERMLYLAARFTVVGLLVSAYLVYVQLFIIHAICVYCMFSAVTSTALFILGMVVLKSLRAKAKT